MKSLALCLVLAALGCASSQPKTRSINLGPQKTAITLAAGSTNDLDVATGTGNFTTVIKLVADAAGSTLTGMDASRVDDGDLFLLRNDATSGVLTITDGDSASLAANRFDTASDAALILPPGHGVLVEYDSSVGWTMPLATAGSPVFSTATVGASGTALTQLRVYSQSLTPSATAAAIGTSAQTFTVTGLSTSDKVYVNTPSTTALCPVVGARASATNTLQLEFATLTAAGCTPAAGTYTVFAVRN